MKEAGIESKQAGERGITARSVKKATGVRRAIIHAQAILMKAADMMVKIRTLSQDSRDEERLTQISIATLSTHQPLVACPSRVQLGRHEP